MITKQGIIRDISDTQKEIDDYEEQRSVLMENPQDNKVRIYMLGGHISQREDFIRKLNSILPDY